jgi:formylmethanofuran dehydrogenase subunit E
MFGKEDEKKQEKFDKVTCDRCHCKNGKHRYYQAQDIYVCDKCFKEIKSHYGG